MIYSKKLQQHKKIKHCFFSKKNGVSEGIYESLNCGIGSKDKKENVNKNLKIVANKMNVPLNNLILMHQSHSNKVIFFNEKNKLERKLNSDALITNLKGFALGVLTADCVPILIYDEASKMIGCIHAGWKGALSGIIENTLNKFKEINNNNNFFISVGPCIGKKSYEVGEEFYQNFLSDSKVNVSFFLKKNDKFLFDLRGYVNAKLLKFGSKNIDNIESDTFEDMDSFFSFRRSKKLGETDYGRCISTIALTEI
tara:strand:- start:126 stop:887 length:762 start_codon:yes stop_codon:yes gene_type:complete